jgi:hypothetical protein
VQEAAQHVAEQPPVAEEGENANQEGGGDGQGNEIDHFPTP